MILYSCNLVEGCEGVRVVANAFRSENQPKHTASIRARAYVNGDIYTTTIGPRRKWAQEEGRLWVLYFTIKETSLKKLTEILQFPFQVPITDKSVGVCDCYISSDPLENVASCVPFVPALHERDPFE